MPTSAVAGSVSPPFEGVRDELAALLAEGAEFGVSFAVYQQGEPVVDLWGGYASSNRSVPVRGDTVFSIFSATKGLSALAIALLVDRGKLSYEVPVAEYWPEFAAHGKHAITVGHVMSHQAGLVGAREHTTLDDFYGHTRIAELLADQVPFFEPGLWGYHSLTVGVLADELVRRVDGRKIGQFFADEVARPLGVDVYLGLPESEDHRAAETVIPQTMAVHSRGFQPPNPAAFEAAINNPPVPFDLPNHRHWREAGLAGGGATATGSGLAKLYGVLACGGTVGDLNLISSATLNEATRERVRGVDQCSGMFARYGAGFKLNSGEYGKEPAAYGHPGRGGSVGFADPQRQLGVGYATNLQVVPELTPELLEDPRKAIDPRLARLLDAVYAADPK